MSMVLPVDFVFSLLLNAALLLSLVQIIDLALARGRVNWLSRPSWAVGVIVGVIAMLLIKVSTTLMPGVIFDTRSVLLAICGLFLGPVPTVIAMAMAASFRGFIGGPAVWAGVAVILASGLIGLAWRLALRRPIETISWRQLYPLGLIVHAAMLALMLLLPREMAWAVLEKISLPVMLIHPLITVALGLLLVERLQRQHDLDALSAREERFQRLFRNAPVAMGLASMEGAILALNCRFEQVFGYTSEDLPDIEAWWLHAYPEPTYRKQVQASWLSALANVSSNPEAIETGEYRIRCKDGAERRVRINAMRMPEGLLTAFIDLTEIRQAEQLAEAAQAAARRSLEQRQQALEMLAAIADATEDAIFAKDCAGRYLLFNRAASRFIDRPVEAVLGRDDHDLYPSEQADSLRAFDREVMRQERPLTQENALDTPAGRQYFLITKGPLHNAAGSVIGVFGVARDISAQKQAEQARLAEQQAELARQDKVRLALLNQMQDANEARAKAEVALASLREQEAFFRLIAENIGDFIAVLDLQGRRLYNSPSYQRFFGAERDLRGSDSFAEIHPDDRERIKQLFQDTVRTGIGHEAEYRMLIVDGSIRQMESRGGVIKDSQGRLMRVIVVSRDITERKHAEREIELQIARLQQAEAHAHLGSWEYEVVSGQGWWSTQMYELMRRDPAAGMPSFAEFLDALHPDDRPVVQTVLNHLAVGEAPMPAVFRSNPERGPLRWFSPTLHCERDAQGRIVKFIGTTLDITELKRTEAALRELNATLEERVALRTAELETLNQSLESFVYSVSHDLKTPLRGVEGYSQLLQHDYAEQLDAEGRLFIANIRTGIARMNELIDDLLAYSRMERRKLDAVPLDLTNLVHSVIAERADAIAAHAVAVHADLPPLRVRGDADGLALVLRNLLENALKFSAQSPQPRIDIDACEQEGGVMLCIRDNGIGFDMKFHDRIFEIFQRLHRLEDYPGTGIGLALVKKAMQRMGGRVWAESAPGTGAAFHLWLPCQDIRATTSP